MTTAFIGAAATYYTSGTAALAGGSLDELARSFGTALSDKINRHFAPPDSFGKVTVVVDGKKIASRTLDKNSNTFTPIWDAAIEDVPIHRAEVRITMKDGDLLTDQPVGKIHFGEEEMLAAEEAGGLYVLDTAEETGGAVLRLLISAAE